MADIAARREARMRRILNNAENRLKRITDDVKYEEVKTDIAPNIHNNPIQHSINETPVEPEITSNDLFQEEKMVNPVQATSTNYIRLRIIILIIIALVTRYLNYIIAKTEVFLNLNLVNTRVENIFIPFLCFKFFELIFIQPNLPQNNKLSLLLMFTNLNQKSLEFLFKVLNFVTSIMADLCIYFFSFTILDVCIYIIK